MHSPRLHKYWGDETLFPPNSLQLPTIRFALLAHHVGNDTCMHVHTTKRQCDGSTHLCQSSAQSRHAGFYRALSSGEHQS